MRTCAPKNARSQCHRFRPFSQFVNCNRYNCCELQCGQSGVDTFLPSWDLMHNRSCLYVTPQKVLCSMLTAWQAGKLHSMHCPTGYQITNTSLQTSLVSDSESSIRISSWDDLGFVAAGMWEKSCKKVHSKDHQAICRRIWATEVRL